MATNQSSLARDANEDLADDVQKFHVLGVDRAMAAGAGGEEDVLVLAVDEQPHGDALFRRGHRLRVRQVAADRHLALRRGPEDGVHLALDDAARIHLHEDFRLVARLHVAQFVLAEKGQHPGIVLLDEAHHRPGRKLRGAHAGTQREIRHAAIGRREMRGAVEVVFRAHEVRFGLGDLRLGLRFRGVGGEEFAFQISEIALRLLEVGPSSRRPSRRAR